MVRRALSNAGGSAPPAAVIWVSGTAGPGKNNKEKAQQKTAQGTGLGPRFEDKMIVLIHIHETIDLRFVFQSDFDEPTFVVWIFIDDRRVFFHMGIDGQHGSGNRRYQFMNRRNEFHFREDLPFLDLITDVRELHGNNLAKFALDIVGETQVNMLVLNVDPDMLFANFDNTFHDRALVFTIGLASGLSRL
jgi:hypothetical protein